MNNKKLTNSKYKKNTNLTLSSARRQRIEGANKLKRIRLYFAGLIILVIAGSVYFQHGRVKEVELIGQVSPELEQEISNLIPTDPIRSSKLLINKTKLEEKILQLDSNIDKASISIPVIGTKLTINVEARLPIALWGKANDKIYAVDINGILFEPKNLQSDNKLPLVTDTTGTTYVLGDQVLLPQYAEFINDFTRGIKLTSLKQEAENNLSFEVTDSPKTIKVSIGSKPYYYLLLISRGVEQQINGINEIELYFKNKGIAPTTYVDLRIEDRAYWK